jgi:hypothetical protein
MTSVYGIRVYKQGSVLAPHVDRLPLVTSAIINVAQDVDEPWSLELIGHDGKAHNVTMEPGQMVLYESHSVIHGRPFPLKGNYYANVFLHFEPLGHTLRHSQEGAYGTTDVDLPDLAKEAYERALQMEQMKDQDATVQKKPKRSPLEVHDLPPYVPEDKKVQWQQQYDFEKEHKVRRITRVEYTVERDYDYMYVCMYVCLTDDNPCAFIHSFIHAYTTYYIYRSLPNRPNEPWVLLQFIMRRPMACWIPSRRFAEMIDPCSSTWILMGGDRSTKLHVVDIPTLLNTSSRKGRKSMNEPIMGKGGMLCGGPKKEPKTGTKNALKFSKNMVP